MHLLTSNFNLLHSNSNWDNLRNKFKFLIDEDYNNFFLVLNNKKNLLKFDTFHIIINIDNNNKKEIINKIKIINNTIKQFKNKIFFFYLTNQLTKNKSIEQIIKLLNIKENKNIYLKIFNDLKGNNFSYRNKEILKFPYDVSLIKRFNKQIQSYIKIYNSNPYKLIILDCF